MFRYRLVLLSMALALTGCTEEFTAGSELIPNGKQKLDANLMLDGDCSDHAIPQTEIHVVDDETTLYVTQSRKYVWLCYSLVDSHGGVLDLRLESPNTNRPLNLHVSAQLGEWEADEGSAIPKSQDDPRWWRTPGWFATPLRFGGLGKGKKGSYPIFVDVPGREIQLSKERFGYGTWRLVFQMDRIYAATDGKPANRTVYPAEGTMTIDVRK